MEKYLSVLLPLLLIGIFGGTVRQVETVSDEKAGHSDAEISVIDRSSPAEYSHGDSDREKTDEFQGDVGDAADRNSRASNYKGAERGGYGSQRMQGANRDQRKQTPIRGRQFAPVESRRSKWAPSPQRVQAQKQNAARNQKQGQKTNDQEPTSNSGVSSKESAEKGDDSSVDDKKPHKHTEGTSKMGWNAAYLSSKRRTRNSGHHENSPAEGEAIGTAGEVDAAELDAAELNSAEDAADDVPPPNEKKEEEGEEEEEEIRSGDGPN